MAMKRKPHHAGLDPNAPGIPVSRDQLRSASATYQRTQADASRSEGVQLGPLAGKAPAEVPQNLTGVDGAAPVRPPQAPPPGPPPPGPPQGSGGNGRPPQQPEPSIPTTFQASGRRDDFEEKHPLLEDLEFNFGIEKLQCADVELAGYRWTFRPMRFEEYEWMSNNIRRNIATGETSEPSLAVAGVSATLAAINGTPVYEVFKVDTTGRHIPDRMNPPPDIKFEAATYILEWFREKVGMWELISELDSQTDVLFEEQRSKQFPLWETLASPFRQRLVELRQLLENSGTEPDGKPGDDASPSPEHSPPTPEPSSSGTTPEQPTSSSTGGSESSGTALTG